MDKILLLYSPSKPTKSKCQSVNKLSSDEIDNIREHMKSDDVTFPLPDCKYVDQRFFHNSMKRAQKCTICFHQPHAKSVCLHIVNTGQNISSFKATFHIAKTAAKDAKTLTM